MIILNVFLETTAKNQEKLEELLHVLVAETRKETGCIYYQYFKNGVDYVFVEHWQDEETLDKHAKSEHFKAFATAAGPLFTKPLDIKKYQDPSA